MVFVTVRNIASTSTSEIVCGWMPGDLQSEIAARRARLAELRKQRPSPSPPASGSSYTEQLKVVTSHVYTVEAPYTYTKSTQTEPIRAEESSTVEKEAQEEPISTTSQPQKFTLDLLQDNEETPKSLKTFLDNAWRAVERSNAGAKPLRDFSVVHGTRAEDRQGGAIAEVSRLGHSDLNTGSITGPGIGSRGISGSKNYSELVATAQGTLHAEIWSLEAPNAPEYTVRAATPIECLVFSPRRPGLVFGGGTNGQILRWDLGTEANGERFDVLPALRSLLDGSGHMDRITGLVWVGGESLVSLGFDGIVCQWTPDLLVRPQRRFDLDLGANKPGSLSGNTFGTRIAAHPRAFAVVVGTLSGQVVMCDLQDTTKPILESHQAHDGPIAALEFRESRAQDTVEGYWLISAGFDWKLRLWHSRVSEMGPTLEPVLEIWVDSIVYDIAWCPGHPSLFVAACDTGLQVWDLARSTTSPIHSLSAPSILTAVQWLGQQIVAGGPEGSASYSIPHNTATEAQWQAFGAKFRP